MEYLSLILLALAIPVMGVVAFFMALGQRDALSRLKSEIIDLRERLRTEVAARKRIEDRMYILDGGGQWAEPRSEMPLPIPKPTVVVEPPAAVVTPAVPSPPTSVPAITPPAATPPPTSADQDLESRLGARWAVWIGGLALALGGIFLARYTIEQGLIGPAGRIALGGLLAACLIAAGEWLRRHEGPLNISAEPRAYIPGVLTAAGSSTAFATVFAAHALYDFLGSGSAFVLLGLVSLATLAASLLHGPWLAALGILAAYATPFFITSTTPNAPALLLYLAFVTATATALGRVRNWAWLVLGAHAAAVAWPFLLLYTQPQPDQLLYAVFAVSLSVIAFGPRIVFGAAPGPAPLDHSATVLAAAHSTVMLAAMAAGRLEESVLTVGLLFIVVQLAAAWRSAALGPLTAVTGVFTIAALCLWKLPLTIEATRDALAQPPLDLLKIPPAAVDRFISYSTMLGALFLVIGLRGAWRGAATVWLAGAGAIVPVALVAVAYARIAAFEPSLTFAFIALGLAIVLAGAAEATRRRPPPDPDVAMALFAAGSVAGLCLGLSTILEKGWLTVALALVSLGLAWIEQSRPVTALRALAVAVAGLVILRLFWYPLATDNPGLTPLFNWLLWGYGVPALAFALAARLFRRGRDDFATRIFEALAIIYGGLTLSLQIRHFVTGGEMFAEGTLIEAGLQTCLAMGFSLALQRLHDRVPSPVFAWASQAFGYGSLALIVLWLGIIANPVFSGASVEGSLLVNDLLPGYLMPAVAAGLLALQRLRRDEIDLAKITAALSLGLGFIWVSLTVRFAFRGGDLTLGDATSTELYAYSAAWLVYAMVLLGVGLASGYRWFRMASAIVMGPTILKVFVVDMAHLEGVLRASSFLGLGLVLVGVGLLYQRLMRSPRLRA